NLLGPIFPIGQKDVISGASDGRQITNNEIPVRSLTFDGSFPILEVQPIVKQFRHFLSQVSVAILLRLGIFTRDVDTDRILAKVEILQKQHKGFIRTHPTARKEVNKCRSAMLLAA